MTLTVGTGLVAALYASVGHGGASGYLALMALAGCEHNLMSTTALLLNLLVAGTAWRMFTQAGHGSWRLIWPFVIGSVPMAIVGGWLQVPPAIYGGCLAIAFIAAAIRLGLQSGGAAPVTRLRALSRLPCARSPRLPAAMAIGAGIGLLSGIVGVGGGIFLSPLMLLCGWANPKRTAAASAGFIVLNSLAGLAGRFAAGRLAAPAGILPLAIAACAGGIIGAHIGARRLPHLALRRVLAGVLVIAAAKWLVLLHA